MTDLSTLLARVESGSGADRELDARVALWFKDGINDRLLYTDEQVSELVELSQSETVTCDACGRQYTAAWVDLRAYTTDLNAVIALVEARLPGWTIANIGQNDSKSWHAELREGYLTSYKAVAYCIAAPTPARALLAALIRAEMELAK